MRIVFYNYHLFSKWNFILYYVAKLSTLFCLFVLFVLMACLCGFVVWFIFGKYTYPLNSNVCFAIAFECVLLGLIGYLIRPPLPPCCCLLLAPPGVPPALLPTLKGDVDRDRDDPYANADDADADGGTGELDWSRCKIVRFGLNAGDCDDNFVKFDVTDAIMLLY